MYVSAIAVALNAKLLFFRVGNFGVRADGQFLSHGIVGRVPFDRVGRLEKALKRRRKERRANVLWSVVTKRLQVRPPTSNSDANDLYAGFCFPFSFHLSLSPSFALVSSLPAYTRDHAHVTLLRYSRNQFTCRDLRRDRREPRSRSLHAFPRPS